MSEPLRAPHTLHLKFARGADDAVVDTSIAYTYEPGLVLSEFLRSLGERRIVGGRCPSCAKVYVPPRPRCPACRTGPMAPVELDGVGSVVSFTVVHLPVTGADLDVPFASAWIRLDGADVSFAHLLGEAELGDVRVGGRVEAVWVADDELAPTWESIRYFRPVTP